MTPLKDQPIPPETDRSKSHWEIHKYEIVYATVAAMIFFLIGALMAPSWPFEPGTTRIQVVSRNDQPVGEVTPEVNGVEYTPTDFAGYTSVPASGEMKLYGEAGSLEMKPTCSNAFMSKIIYHIAKGHDFKIFVRRPPAVVGPKKVAIHK